MDQIKDTLPDKLSELIRVALQDLRNGRPVWYWRCSTPDEPHAAAPPERAWPQGSKYLAVCNARLGLVWAALVNLGHDPDDPAIQKFDRKMANTIEGGPAQFYADMEQLATDLAAAGY